MTFWVAKWQMISYDSFNERSTIPSRTGRRSHLLPWTRTDRRSLAQGRMDLDEMASGRANNDIFPGHTTMVKRLTNNAVFRDPVLTAVQNSCGPLESSTESMT